MTHPALGLSRAPSRFGLGWGIPWEMAKEIGRVVPRLHGGRVTSWQIVIHHDGQRWRLGHAMVGAHYRKLETEDDALFVLGSIRAEASSCGSVARAVAPHLRRADESMLIPRWMKRWVALEKDRCAAEEISPRTLGELERQIEAKSFDYWKATHIFSVSYGAIEDWNRALAHGGTPKTMRARILENFRRFLRWLERRGEIDSVPQFPQVRTERKPPEILRPEDQAAVIAEVPQERRGIFIAMRHTLRPGEARAMDLLRWRSPDMLVQRAFKGLSAESPIRGLKEGDWRVVGADAELAQWVEWRMAQASPEERLKREDVPLFPNPETGGGWWSHHALDREWRRACKRAKVAHVPLYAGTKHSTATELIRQGVSPKVLQRFLGHADQRSTDGYVVLAEAEVKDLVRGKP